jgi:transposase
MGNVRYVGLDVHKDSIVMSVAEAGNAEAKVLGTFPNDINKIIKQLKKLSPDVSLLRVCYEAGPTGFGLSRGLK